MSATIRDVIEKAHDPAANAVADLREHAAAAGEAASDYASQARGLANQAGKSLKRAASDAGDKLQDGYEAARKYAVSHSRDAVALVRQHPTTAIAIAVGVGVLVGGLFLMRRR